MLPRWDLRTLHHVFVEEFAGVLSEDSVAEAASVV